MSTVTAISFKPKATRKRLKKRLKKKILSDDFKKREIFWKNIAENFPPHITTWSPSSSNEEHFMSPSVSVCLSYLVSEHSYNSDLGRNCCL
jgi:hypothetical protein